MKSVKKRKTVADFPELAAQWHPTKNGDLKPEDFAFKSNKKAWWQCEKGHEWEAVICLRTRASLNRKRGNGCAKCCGRMVCMENCLATTHPEIADQWHPSKNEPLTPYDVVIGSRKLIFWMCEKGHEWQALLYERKNGNGNCRICLGLDVTSENCLATTHPEIAEQWHPTKNKPLTPHDVKAGSNKEIHWLCKEKHEWRAKISDRKRGNGCPKCSGRVASPENCLATTHPEMADQWHPTKNEPLTPYDVKAGSDKKIFWVCECGNSFCRRVANMRQMKRCKRCSNREVHIGNCLATTHPEIADQWHHTKNGTTTPYDVTAGSGRKFHWVCERKHEWPATVKHRTNGRGCPVCDESKGERKIAESLDNCRLAFKREVRFKNCKSSRSLPFDFLVRLNERKGFLIEYQGIQHYKPVRFKTSWTQQDALKALKKCQKRDRIKAEWARKNKIPLLVIPYWDHENIPERISDFLNTLK